MDGRRKRLSVCFCEVEELVSSLTNVASRVLLFLGVKEGNDHAWITKGRRLGRIISHFSYGPTDYTLGDVK